MPSVSASLRSAPASRVGAIAGVAAAAAAGAAYESTRRRRRRNRRFRVGPDEPLGAGLRRATLGQLDAAIHALEHCEDDPSRAIHGARKSIKRARSTLRLLRPQLGDERFAAADAGLQAVAHRLASERSAAALPAVLEALVTNSGVRIDPQDLAALRARFAQPSGCGVTIDHAAAELRAARGRVHELPALDERAATAAALAGVRRAQRSGRARWRRAVKDPSTENLHGWRRRVNELRHDAELLREADPKRLRALSGRARELADLLGEDHDLAELDGLASDLSSIHAAIEDRRGELRRSVFALGRQLYARPPLVRRLRKRTAERTAWGTAPTPRHA